MRGRARTRSSLCTRGIALVVFSLLCLPLVSGQSARAEPAAPFGERYALLFGANEGDRRDPQLRYAHQDLERLADTLELVGGFRRENIIVLKSPSAELVRRRFSELSARVRQSQEGRGSFLFVFFTGHADDVSLHLGRSQLDWQEIRNWTEAASAQARLLIVDACRSGQATRVKGFESAAPFLIGGAKGEPLPEGFAVLSSAAAGETAHESDELQASLFTFHFIGGLHGLADKDGDARVTLGEAFAYTSARTLASSLRTVAGPQHPTYRYELKGRQDIVLASVSSASSLLGQVSVREEGTYLFRRGGPRGDLLHEVELASGSKELMLQPGVYFVSRLTDKALHEGQIDVTAGQAKTLTSASLRRVPLTEMVSKGARDTVFSVAAQGHVAEPLLDGYGPAFGVGARAAWLSRDWMSDALVSVRRETTSGIKGSQGSVGALVGVVGFHRLWPVGVMVLGTGIRLGVLYAEQDVVTTLGPSRGRTLMPTGEMVLRAALPVGGEAHVGAEAGVGAARFSLEGRFGAKSANDALWPFFRLEVGWAL